MEPPRLRSEGLVLDAPTVDDASEWAAAQDEECARWFDWPSRPTVERCRAYLIQVSTDPRTDSYTWAIRAEQVAVGGINLKLDDDKWKVSYFVGPHHRGQGIARQALRLVADWAFASLGLGEIWTRVHVENVASQKVLEATGFTNVRAERNPEAEHEDFVYVLHQSA